MHHTPKQIEFMGKYGYTIKALANIQIRLCKFSEALQNFEEAGKFINLAYGETSFYSIGILKRKARALF